MKKIIDYQIARANTRDALEIRVKEDIGQGWEPYGNLIWDINKNYLQAMVRYEYIPTSLI